METARQGGVGEEASDVSSVLQQLPATTSAAGGFLEFASAVNPATFVAPLTAGGNIDAGTFLSFVGTGGQAQYQ